MTALVCIPCLLTGGTEIQTLSLVKALVSRGYSVTVVCYFEFAKPMVDRYKSAGAEIRLLSPEGSRKNGISATSKYLWKELKKVVKEIKPDIAHVQYMAPGALPILILRSLGVKKIVATAHTSGDIYSKNGLRLVRFLTKNILSGFQCITERAEISFFGERGVNNKSSGKHFTIYNCIPEYVTVKDFETKEFNKQITIGVVSRLEHIKGMDLVVQAFAEIHKQFPNTRLLVVGDGSLRSLMEKQAEKIVKEDGGMKSVEFVGRQNQDKLQDFYDRIDILLMPSRSEGFGLTAVEGMARGCVPVVANTGGLPEVVRDGVDGLLHNPEDMKDMVEKLKMLLRDRKETTGENQNDLLLKFSKAAIRRAQDFSTERYSASIATWYDRLLPKPN